MTASVRFLRHTVLLVALVALTTVAAFGQESPVCDGVVSSGEYQVESDYGPMSLHASFGPEKIYLAVVGKTNGWVAVGLGSKVMDGATILMGYVTDGKEAFTVQRGVRHSHRDATAEGILAHAMSESGGTTTMELVLNRADFIKSDQTTLDLIYAEGISDNFVYYHMFRGSTALKIP